MGKYRYECIVDKSAKLETIATSDKNARRHFSTQISRRFALSEEDSVKVIEKFCEISKLERVRNDNGNSKETKTAVQDREPKTGVSKKRVFRNKKRVDSSLAVKNSV